MTGEHDPDNRRCMLWNEDEQDLDFKSFTKDLIKLRDIHPSFKSYDYHFIDSNVLAFTKDSNQDHILVLINNGEQAELSLPKGYEGDYKNLLTSKTIHIHDKMVLETYEFLILSKEV